MAALLVLMIAPSSSAGAGTGTIKGKVTALNGGAPIEGIEVCAYRLGGFEEACRLSKADGTYSITGLAAGKYVVEFWRRNLNYVTQYYNNREFFEEADEVTVSAGGTVENVNAQLQEGGEIEGAVTAEGGGPVAEVLVCAFEEGEEEFSFGGCAESDENGEYAIVGMRAGEYIVEFFPGFSGFNYLTQFYDHKANFEEADVVPVALGEVKSGIDAELEPGAAIEGAVFSASSGAGLGGILVCAVGSPAPIVCTETFGGGHYALLGLSSGAYKVGFSVEFREFFPGEPPEEDGYLTQYYNGKATIAAADVLHLTPPDLASGIDAHLVKPPVPARPVFLPAPLGTFPAVPNVRPKPSPHCRQGFKKKRVKGKLRCVKVHQRKHHSATHRGRIPERLLLPVR